MGGRPIGFRVWSGEGSTDAKGTEDLPVFVSVVYNSCNCPASYFEGGLALSDMEIVAVIGA